MSLIPWRWLPYLLLVIGGLLGIIGIIDAWAMPGIAGVGAGAAAP